MFDKILLLSVQELVEMRLVAYRRCEDESCLLRQFVRQVQGILCSEKLTDEKIDELLKLS